MTLSELLGTLIFLALLIIFLWATRPDISSTPCPHFGKVICCADPDLLKNCRPYPNDRHLSCFTCP